MYKIAGILRNSDPNWSKLGSFVDKHHVLHVLDSIFGKNWEKRCNGGFSFLLMALVLSVKSQSKLAKSSLVNRWSVSGKSNVLS